MKTLSAQSAKKDAYGPVIKSSRGGGCGPPALPVSFANRQLGILFGLAS